MRTLAVLACLTIATVTCSSDRAGRAPPRAPPPATATAGIHAEVPVLSRYELVFDVPGTTVHPDDARVRARFSAPSGAITTVGGVSSHGRFLVRFTPRERGPHPFIIFAGGGEHEDAARGDREVTRGTLLALPASRRGFVRRDPSRPHRLVADDGTEVRLLGENRINVYDPTWNYGNADTREYLKRMASYGMTAIRVFLFSDCESETVSGGYQIGCLEREIGRFDEQTADAIDVLFDAAEETGIDVVLVAYAIGFTPAPETWRSWDDNPYSKARGGPAAAPSEFFTSKELQRRAARKLGYIADRWASSPRLLAIDLLNEPEWDGPIGERTWIPWAEAMSQVWRSVDPYGHLVTAGPVGLHWNIDGDEHPWYASPANDLVEWHLYGKEFYAPHALALEMDRKVRETWSFRKPIFCGEFGYGGEDPSSHDHTHDGIWSLLFSGAGALVHTAPQFEIDSDAPMTPSRGAHFRVLSDLLRSFDPKAPLTPARDVHADPPGTNAWSLVADTPPAGERALWLLAPRETYGQTVGGARVTFPPLPEDRWTVRWIDDVTGQLLATEAIQSDGRRDVTLSVPLFRRHVAARITRSR